MRQLKLVGFVKREAKHGPSSQSAVVEKLVTQSNRENEKILKGTE